ncbi:MAG: AAA family ATPase [Ruminococcus flavefaciens]|nr:AAA family ATPase [Ruminococcus flavefaciens]
MTIKWIEMTYFFRIYQSSKIEFSVDEIKNVTVIKGDNGTGKTTILSAFSWVFYGEVEEPLSVDKMLNKRRIYEMNQGDIEEARVKVCICDDQHTYIISRSQRFKKVSSNETVIVGEPNYYAIDQENSSSMIEDKTFFESIIPKDLKGFFFFDGERIDRLAKIDGREEIRNAILDILGLRTLEKIEDAIGEVQSEYNKQVKKITKSKVIQQLRQEYDDAEESIKADEIRLDSTRKRKKDAEKQIEISNKFLKEHNAESVKNLQLKRENLEKEKGNIVESQEREKQEICKLISKNFKYYLLSERLPEISQFLEEKRKKKELPSDIKQQFVRDLLESGECICGQKLEPTSTYYIHIQKLLKTAGREELDNAYINMRAFIDSNEISEITTGFYTRIMAYEKKIMEKSQKVEGIDKQVKEISSKLSTDYGDLIANHENMRQQAEEIKSQTMADARFIEQEIKKTEKRKSEIEAQLKEEQGKQENRDKFEQAFEIATELGRLNKEIRKLFIDITREDMDAKIKNVFASISRKDDREAVLTDNFELVVQNKITHQPQILSTGERQITSLAFIGALVAYAKEKNKSNLITDFSGGDFPIVMDSAFGNLGSVHKANIALGLPKLASQVIVMVSDEQWQGTVEENIAERVWRVYNMKDGEYDGKDDEYTKFER